MYIDIIISNIFNLKKRFFLSFQLTPYSQGTQEISFKLHLFETAWRLMRQVTNSNVCRTVTDGLKKVYVTDPKKKNPYWTGSIFP